MRRLSFDSFLTGEAIVLKAWRIVYAYSVLGSFLRMPERLRKIVALRADRTRDRNRDRDKAKEIDRTKQRHRQRRRRIHT